MKRLIVVICFLCTLLSSSLSAEVPRLFVGLGVGIPFFFRDFHDSQRGFYFQEEFTRLSDYNIRGGIQEGALLGFYFLPNSGVLFLWSRSNADMDLFMESTYPHPYYVHTLRPLSLTRNDLSYRVNQWDFNYIYRFYRSQGLALSLFVGYTLLSVKPEILQEVSVSEVSPYTVPVLKEVVLNEERVNTSGINFGVLLQKSLFKRAGGALFIQYTDGEAEMKRVGKEALKLPLNNLKLTAYLTFRIL